MKVLLVDDEPLAHKRLRALLADHPHVEVVGEASSVAEAEGLLPGADVVFLDVEMPGGDGFTLRPGATKVVFVTAHPQHAVKAFDVEATDYLVKPVTAPRLARTLERLGAPSRRWTVRDGAGAAYVDAAELLRLAGADDYTELFLRDGRRLLSDDRLRTWEGRLGGGFVRVHRSHLVARDAVQGLEKSPSRAWTAVLTTGERVPVARARLGLVRAALAS